MAIQPTENITAQPNYVVQDSRLIHLPVELVQRVLGNVYDIRSVLACSQTCKQWNILMQQDPKSFQCFWKYLVERDLYWDATNCQTVDFQEVYKKRHFFSHVFCSNFAKGIYDSHSLKGHKNSVFPLLIVEGKLVSGAADNTIKFWDLESKTCLHTLLNTGATDCLLFDEGMLFASSTDNYYNNNNTINIWDWKSKSYLYSLYWHENRIYDLAIAKGKLFSGSADKTIKIWDLESKECVETLHGHTGCILKLLYAGGKLFSGSADKTIKIWDLETNKCLHTLLGHTGMISCLFFAEGRLFSACSNGKIKIWDLGTNTCLHTLEEGEDWWIRNLFIVEGRLISGADTGRIKIWNLETNTCLHTLARCAHTLLYSDGMLISAENGREEINILDFNLQQLAVRFDTGYGNSLVLCGEGGGLSWNPSKGLPLQCEGKDRWVISLPKSAKEFKLVWKKKDGSCVWEEGKNRVVGNASSINIERIQFEKKKYTQAH